jgi:hypothetical protein
MQGVRNIKARILIVTLGFFLLSNKSFGQEGVFEFPLSIGGQALEEFLLDRDGAGNILRQADDFDIDDPQLPTLLQRINEGYVPLQQVPDNQQGLLGIGAFGLRLVLGAYLEGWAYKVRGKIRDYVYVDETHSGHLAVEVGIQTFASAATRDAGGPPIRVESLHWDIDVDGAYQVHERGTDLNNPFPGVTDLTLPAEAISSIWDPFRDLKYKLHAKGTKIIVRHVYRKINGGPLELLPSNDFRYTSTEESCIDLLFNPFPPETQLPHQNGYCLGRCKHPFIVNTGGG